VAVAVADKLPLLEEMVALVSSFCAIQLISQSLLAQV
jgi:hypothetical protein